MTRKACHRALDQGLRGISEAPSSDTPPPLFACSNSAYAGTPTTDAESAARGYARRLHESSVLYTAQSLAT